MTGSLSISAVEVFYSMEYYRINSDAASEHSTRSTKKIILLNVRRTHCAQGKKLAQIVQWKIDISVSIQSPMFCIDWSFIRLHLII